MRTQYCIKLFLLVILLIITAAIKNSFSATHLWIVVGMPTPKPEPELGKIFTTYIGISTWNGIPGATDFNIQHDPNVLRILKITIDENSPFFPTIMLIQHPASPDKRTLPVFNLKLHYPWIHCLSWAKSLGR